MSVGCKTLLLPVGFYPIRIWRRFYCSARPRLIPGLAPTVILPVAGLSQGRLAARTACPIGAGGATAPRGVGADSQLIWERSLCSPIAGNASGAALARVKVAAAHCRAGCDT